MIITKKKTSSDPDAAVALRYDAGTDAAPRVTAKGRGNLAKKIIEVAQQSDVPIYADSHLMAMLYEVSLDKAIPESLYQLVAEVMAWVYSVDAHFRRKSGG